MNTLKAGFNALSPALGMVPGIFGNCLVNEQVPRAWWEPSCSQQKGLNPLAPLAGGGLRDELDLAAHGLRLKSLPKRQPAIFIT